MLLLMQENTVNQLLSEGREIRGLILCLVILEKLVVSQQKKKKKSKKTNNLSVTSEWKECNVKFLEFVVLHTYPNTNELILRIFFFFFSFFFCFPSLPWKSIKYNKKK